MQRMNRLFNLFSSLIYLFNVVKKTVCTIERVFNVARGLKSFYSIIILNIIIIIIIVISFIIITIFIPARHRTSIGIQTVHNVYAACNSNEKNKRAQVAFRIIEFGGVVRQTLFIM